MIAHASSGLSIKASAAATARGGGSINPFPLRIFAATRGPGRPVGADPKSERSCKPWIALGISERTYYRRKPRQQRAHVDAWILTLGSIKRLEHRSFVRECERLVARSSRREQTSGDLHKLYTCLRRAA